MTNPTKLRRLLDVADVTLGDCIAAFAASERDPYVIAARRQHEPGVLELGEPTFVSETPTGAYVLAWLWVPKACAQPNQLELDLSPFE